MRSLFAGAAVIGLLSLTAPSWAQTTPDSSNWATRHAMEAQQDAAENPVTDSLNQQQLRDAERQDVPPPPPQQAFIPPEPMSSPQQGFVQQQPMMTAPAPYPPADQQAQGQWQWNGSAWVWAAAAGPGGYQTGGYQTGHWVEHPAGWTWEQ